MKNILILEDDQTLAKTLQSALEGIQTKVTVAHTLESFYTRIEKNRFDVCVMDRLIDTEDALEALGYVRDILPHAKILFLSKKAAVMDRIHGLEEGADDYMAKPFSLAELRLRARRLLAEGRGFDQKVISLGELNFYPDQGIVESPEKKLYLRKREGEILQYLSQANGACVSKAALSTYLWPASREINANTIDVYVRRLRQKLGPFHSILETRRGFGYRLVLHQREAKHDRGAVMRP